MSRNGANRLPEKGDLKVFIDKNPPWLRMMTAPVESGGSGAEKVSSGSGADGELSKVVDVEAALEKARADAEKWKNFSRTWEERAKANEEAAKRIEELEDEDRTEAEKLRKKVADAEEAAANARTEQVKANKARATAEIAHEFKLSKEDRELFLTGDDEETLRKQAEALSRRGQSRGESPNQGQGSSGGGKAGAISWGNSLLGIDE